MLNRYRVRLTKKYDFDLDGTSEQDIREQVIYISDETQILKLPEVRKNIKIRYLLIFKGEFLRLENTTFQAS